MADYAIIQVSKVGKKTIYTYMTRLGNTTDCFADSSISCGKTFSNVSECHFQLTKKFPKQEFEMVTERFIGNENL